MAKRVQLRWIGDPELSAAHAALLVATGARCADEKTEQLLIRPVTEINNRLLSASVDMGTFWRTYYAEKFRDPGSDQACANALIAGGCSELQMDQTCKVVLLSLIHISEPTRPY